MRYLLASIALAYALVTLAPVAASAAVRCDFNQDNAPGSGCFTDEGQCFDQVGCVTTPCPVTNTCECTPDAACESAVVPPTIAPATTGQPPRTTLVNPLGVGVDIRTLIGRVTRALMGISGSLALLLFVYGGFLWTTSAGNMDKVKQGKRLFTSAALGLLVIFSSYVAVAAIFNALGI